MFLPFSRVKNKNEAFKNTEILLKMIFENRALVKMSTFSELRI